MKNILFIGNGFDLNNGLKTRYNDYFESLKIDDIRYLIIVRRFNKIANSFRNMKIVLKTQWNKDEFASCYISIDKLKSESDWLGAKLPIQQLEKNFKNNLAIYDELDQKIKFLIIYLLLKKSDSRYQSIEFIGFNFLKDSLILLGNEPTDVNRFLDNLVCANEKEFTFKSCFPYYILGILSRDRKYKPKEFWNLDENWVDIERVLYQNQFERFLCVDSSQNETNYTDSRYNLFLKNFNKKRGVIDDFNIFKVEFLEYLKEQQKNMDKKDIREKISKIQKRFSPDVIYNFNYTNYINSYFKELNPTIIIDNLHGDIESGKNIVFGTNHYLFNEEVSKVNEKAKNNKGKEINDKEVYYKLTKMYQVLELESKRESVQLEEVKELTILGHSIGEQDFEYMHTIINTNPQEIIINIVWASWLTKEGNTQNNKEELKEATYFMLTKYEELYGNISIHKMILENRIRFIHLQEILK